MLQLVNQTALSATLFAAPNPEGIDSLYTIVKGTFALDRLDAGGVPPLAEKQLPIAPSDEYYGDPTKSSVRVPSDIALIKPTTDVLLIGSAYAPLGTQRQWLDATLAAGPLRKTVRVFGDRVWRSGEATPPQPFQRMPLVWERAFGGVDPAKGTPQAEARNPVGAGFKAPNGEKELEGMPLPNLEDPASGITSWKDRPAPACLAPIPPHWEPRRSRAGTYDAAWQKSRAPYLPKDFDPRYFQLAPEGLTAPAYFQGGEVVDLTGLTPSGRFVFRLPALRVQVGYQVGGAPESPPVNLDTILIEPDSARVSLVWRTVLTCDKKLLAVEEIEVLAA
jgi:hypothetical protein